MQTKTGLFAWSTIVFLAFLFVIGVKNSLFSSSEKNVIDVHAEVPEKRKSYFSSG